MADRKLGADFRRRNAIYLITCNVNGKLYVGQTRELLWDRWRGHRNAATGKPEQSYPARTAIARAMRKYGVEQFTLSILEICASADDLDAREAHWIVALGTLTPLGYNLTTGGNTSRRTPEVAAAISAANKGRVKTPEWRAKLSAAKKGKPLWSPEERARIGAQHRGRPESPESIRKRSEALKGRKLGPYSAERCAAVAAGMTPEGRLRSIEASRLALTGKKRGPMSAETKAKISLAQIGKTLSAERRAQISAVQKGKKRGPLSQETCAKISAVLKGRKPSPQTMAGLQAYRDSGVALGRKLGPKSLETRARIAAALKGRKRGPMSEEIKAKISATKRANGRKKQTDGNTSDQHRHGGLQP